MEENDRESKLSKLLLNLEYVLIIVAVITFIASILIVGLTELKLVYKILLMVYAVIQLSVLCVCSVIIETQAGYYECKHCGHKYVPTYKQSICAMHMGRTKYMKCPKCEKKSWQKKVVK